TTTVSERFASPTADIVLCSSNGVAFKVHRVLLAEASSFFRMMFEIPQPPSSSPVPDDVPVINVSETDDVIDVLLRWVYPIPDKPTVSSWESLDIYLEAACKYDINIAIHSLKEILKSDFLDSSPVRVYGLA
ncbi:hypothetical protein BOTBODRAFT_95408, partial [Botryobasidium botryosum FD-172 SS1]